LAAARYPGGFDWFYTVASALASRKHNPEGSYWFSGALIISMALLWFSLSTMRQKKFLSFPRLARASLGILRLGLISGCLMGMERLLIFHLSDLIHKAHEILALLTFLGFYLGILGLLIVRLSGRKNSFWPVLLVASPLLAIGLTQLWLYLDQRDLGWVDTSWREMGVPFWLSFAFWQWWAMACLWQGLGWVVLSGIGDRSETLSGCSNP